MAMLTDLASVLRKAGLEVVEMPGWKTRGRPGAFNPKGVLCHHTAGPGDGYNDAWYMAAKGRPDLSAPLAQLALSRKGVFYVLAAGRANHAGRCKAIGGLKPYPGESYGDGNEQMIGIEAQNRGTDAEGWEPAQYNAYVRGVAAICKHYGWSIVFGHKETSTSGKVDPDFNMSTFRADVAATNPSTAPQKDDDMPLTDDDVTKNWTGVAALKDVRATNPDTAPRVAGSALVEYAALKGKENAAAITALTAKVDALTRALSAQKPATVQFDPVQLEAALRKVIGSVDKETNA